MDTAAIDALAKRFGDYDARNDCYAFNRTGPHSVRALVAEALAQERAAIAQLAEASERGGRKLAAQIRARG